MDWVSYSETSDNNNKYVLTLQDELTGYVQAYPIPDEEAVTVASWLINFCQHFGVPKRFHSGQGIEFMNGVMKQLMRFLGSSQTFSIPPTNKRCSRCFHAILRDHISHISQIIPFAIICHNTSINTSTGYTLWITFRLQTTSILFIKGNFRLYSIRLFERFKWTPQNS